MNNIILVTGATGLVGKALCHVLEKENYPVRAVVRGAANLPFEMVSIEDLSRQTDWSDALQGVDCVVHCAARVHVMRDQAPDPLDAFRQVNVQGTLQLARQAAAAKVRRFVFVSSIKVNGEASQEGHPLAADDTPAPIDAYGVSKHEAEQSLRELAARTGMEVVIVRPPLVYGPGVRANFGALVKWLRRGMPLPLGAIHNNRRSLVALGNLTSLLRTCIEHPHAANQTFMVSDGEDLSTTELLRRLGHALGRPARLAPVPVGWLEAGGRLLGRPHIVQRLTSNLQVDITKTRELLNWAPPISVAEGLRQTVAGTQD